MPKISLFRSSTFLLTMTYVSVFTLSVLILMGFIYLHTFSYMAQQTDSTIESEINGLKESYRHDGIPGLTQLIANRASPESVGSIILLLVDPKLNVVAGNLGRWPNVPGTPDGWLNFKLEEKQPSDDTPRWARARRFRLAEGFFLLVGRDLYDLEMSRKAIAGTLTWALVIAAVMALAGGLAMTRRLLRRIEMINQTSNEIINGDLSRRIPTGSTGDDFDQLSTNLNQMLDRIEKLMAGVRRVSDNIAHDLRTPLARLRNHLDELKSDFRNADDAELVEQAIQEADGLLATFNALLRIARIESERQPDYLVDVDLSLVIRDAADLYEPLAEEKSQTLELSIPGTQALVRGDRGLLSQVVANILDNAVKYTPPEGTIQVNLSIGPLSVSLMITDSGSGIPASEREKVFQRFYRLESSRSSPGNGLGLSLVAAVVTLHRARIRLEDNRPGLRVVIDFPKPHR
ncbi:MAG: sensor histidine kinase [Methylococcales bacterium]